MNNYYGFAVSCSGAIKSRRGYYICFDADLIKHGYKWCYLFGKYNDLMNIINFINNSISKHKMIRLKARYNSKYKNLTVKVVDNKTDKMVRLIHKAMRLAKKNKQVA